MQVQDLPVSISSADAVPAQQLDESPSDDGSDAMLSPNPETQQVTICLLSDITSLQSKSTSCFAHIVVYQL